MVSANISVKRNRIYKDDSVFYHSEEISEGDTGSRLEEEQENNFSYNKESHSLQERRKRKESDVILNR